MYGMQEKHIIVITMSKGVVTPQVSDIAVYCQDTFSSTQLTTHFQNAESMPFSQSGHVGMLVCVH